MKKTWDEFRETGLLEQALKISVMKSGLTRRLLRLIAFGTQKPFQVRHNHAA